MDSREELGTKLYDILIKVYPELAPKLVGMLLQLGVEECRQCLDSQDHLALRLDEAMMILDEAGQCGRVPVKAALNERRIDPEDGQARTLEELRKLCHLQFSAKEIDDYWLAMKPVGAAPASVRVDPSPPVRLAMKPVGAAPPSVKVDASPPVAAKPSMMLAPPKGATALIPELGPWLAMAKLSKYFQAAERWVDEQGACSLDEVEESLDEFAADLALKPLEKQRLEKIIGVRPEALLPLVEATEASSVPVSVEERDETEAISLGSREEKVVSKTETQSPAQLREVSDDFPALGGNVTQGRGKKGVKRM